MNHIRLFILISFLFLTSCVSVNLGGGKASKATDISYVAPKSSFDKIKNEGFDHAWQNPKNGNTIAFLSECRSKTDISMQLMEKESLEALENLKIIKSNLFEYNEREAKELLAEGQVDGIPVKIQLVLLKKNECNYTISFVGRKKFFDVDQGTFQTFLTEFKAP